ncbi:type VI secretion system Vgr family protein [Paraburkholderia susongensis]|uniref:Type VI secretion system secreted protein VgrG n=1 Tax=Paraburkholderia susongensis TaxID=1515439 RepID=A0A1X7M4L3_9BURK|nr:type VI secretion system tip protein VgrG [Paraburkholderia susongensis]SMG61136.1 type VI secretion system secreted protein VgrG [Paraburkholderia susongensis]
MRLIEASSPSLQPDETVLSFRAQERLSIEPDYLLEFTSPRPDVDLNALLGSEVNVSIDTGAGASRYFQAYAFGARDTGQLQNLFTYRLELGSWLSFLIRNQNCRIFQDLTVPQIVEQIFGGYPQASFRFDLSRDYAVREYCVQFLESDLTFVKRLLESEGLYFFFEHTASQQTLVISDTQQFADLDAPYATLQFLPDGEEHRAIAGREGIQRIHRTRTVQSTNVVLRDFDYLAPGKSLEVDARNAQDTLPGRELELYDYAAGYTDLQRGEWLAQLRLEALQAEAHLLTGSANAMGLATGGAFTLTGHPDAQRNRRYVLISTQLSWLADLPNSNAQGTNFVCEYLALADDQPFRPLRLTPWPELPGTHSATVVGPPGSEVHTDSLGRIRVHFHWDRYHSTEEDASCWLRVSQAWAGKGWGFVAMPRVGQEVLIAYLDGQLDRPLAVGMVYNGDNPVPYDLPKDIRYSGMVSRSLCNGQVPQASQITFDDQRGSERLMLHAERDLQQTAERNQSVAVGNHMNLCVARILTITTGAYSPAAADASTSSGSSSDAGVSFKPVANSVTGISNSATGVSNSATGVSNSATGVSNSATGVSNSATGISNSATGISNSATGVSNSATGISESATGLSLSLTGMNASLSGMIVSLTGVSISLTAMSISMTGTRASFTGTEISETGASLSVSGVSSTFTGVSTSFKGLSASFTGIGTSFVGQSTSMAGISVSLTGLSQSGTGASISMTGDSTSTTGISMSMTGQSTSMTGTSQSATGISTSSIGTASSFIGTSNKTVMMSTSRIGTSLSNTGISNSTKTLSISQTNTSQTRTGNSRTNTSCSVTFTQRGTSLCETLSYANTQSLLYTSTGTATGTIQLSTGQVYFSNELVISVKLENT